MEKASSIWFSSEESKGVNILNLIDGLEGCRKVLEKSWGNNKKIRSNEKIPGMKKGDAAMSGMFGFTHLCTCKHNSNIMGRPFHELFLFM